MYGAHCWGVVPPSSAIYAFIGAIKASTMQEGSVLQCRIIDNRAVLGRRGEYGRGTV